MFIWTPEIFYCQLSIQTAINVPRLRREDSTRAWKFFKGRICLPLNCHYMWTLNGWGQAKKKKRNGTEQNVPAVWCNYGYIGRTILKLAAWVWMSSLIITWAARPRISLLIKKYSKLPARTNVCEPLFHLKRRFFFFFFFFFLLKSAHNKYLSCKLYKYRWICIYPYEKLSIKNIFFFLSTILWWQMAAIIIVAVTWVYRGIIW